MKHCNKVFFVLLSLSTTISLCMNEEDSTLAFNSEEYRRKIKEVGRLAHKEEAQRLLDAGMNVNTKGFLGYTMLLHSISYLHESGNTKIPEEKRLEFIKFLLDQGAELHPNTKEWQEIPMLTATTSNMGPKIIALFKEYGADINIKHPSNGLTALHLAASNGHLNVVNFLLNQTDIEIDPIDNEGSTPLIGAVFWGYADIVQALVNKGARKDIKDNTQKSALDYATISPTYQKKSELGVKIIAMLQQ